MLIKVILVNRSEGERWLQNFTNVSMPISKFPRSKLSSSLSRFYLLHIVPVYVAYILIRTTILFISIKRRLDAFVRILVVNDKSMLRMWTLTVNILSRLESLAKGKTRKGQSFLFVSYIIPWCGTAGGLVVFSDSVFARSGGAWLCLPIRHTGTFFSWWLLFPRY